MAFDIIESGKRRRELYPHNTALPQQTLDEGLLQKILADPAGKAAFTAGGDQEYAYKAKNNIITPGNTYTRNVGGTPTMQKDENIFLTRFLPAAAGLASFGLAAPAIFGGAGAAAAGAGGGAAAALPSTALPMAVTGAPSTGGILGGIFGAGTTGGKILDTIGKVGPIAGAVAKGRADGRLDEADYGLRRDIVDQNRAKGNADIDTVRLRQMILLSLLGGEDAKITPPAHIAERMPQMSGGLRPSNIAGREEIIAALRPRLLAALLSGEHLPELSDAPEANILDNLLSGLGTVGGFAGALQTPKTGTPAPTTQTAPAPGLGKQDLMRGMRIG